MFGLAGWLILLPLFQKTSRRPIALAALGGFVLGLSLVVKDIAIVVVLPPLLVAIWRHWADRKALSVAAVFSLVPTIIYLLTLASVGALGAWVSQESVGLQRMIGLKKVTGFSEGGHPSLLSTLLRQTTLYGLSYLVCGLGVLAAAFLIRRQNPVGVRVLACITFSAVLTLLYAATFGTIETQMFYFPAIPSLIALPVALAQASGAPLLKGAHVSRSFPRKARKFVLRCLIGLLAVILVLEGAICFHIRTVPDNGMQRLVTWFDDRGSGVGVIANDTDVPQLVLAHYGFHTVAAGSPSKSRSEGVQYITILSISVQGNYSTLNRTQAAWYRSHGTLVYRFTERSYGQISVYHTDSSSLW
jgi:hypothetical protein